MVSADVNLLGTTLAQVALAWVLSSDVPLAAILGTRKIERLEENLGSAGNPLSEEHYGCLESLISEGVEGSWY